MVGMVGGILYFLNVVLTELLFSAKARIINSPNGLP